MNTKKIKRVRREIRKIGFDPDHGHGLQIFKQAKRQYAVLNKFERANI